ncbi:MAG: response regulator [Dissulfurispiraceae bacterium]
MQKKIIIIVIFNVIVISVSLGLISYLAVHESIERSLQNRIALARIISHYVEVFLNENLSRLQNISLSDKATLKNYDWAPEKKMLENAYKYSLFTDGVFLLDKHGNELLTYPPHVEYFSNLTYINFVNQALRDGRPVISNVYTIEPINKKVIFIITPLKDSDGRIAGLAGGMLGLTDNFISKLLQSAKFEDNRYIEIIDSNEVVVASDRPSYVLQHHDHGSQLTKMIMGDKSGIVECKHGYSNPNAVKKPTDLLAFVPLKMARWGVIVGQSEKDIFAPAIGLQMNSLLLVLLFVGASIIISIVASMKIVKPLKLLTSSTDRISSGDLSTPVGDVGSDEILQLSKSFDDMRIKLAASLDSIKTQNIELETRVAKRTEQIRESRKKVQHLLKKIISSQEDERRRVARDLHDTVLQDISAFLINLDMYKLRPDLMSAEKIDEMRSIAMKAIDSIHKVVKNLRPSILDDFGIDTVVVWLLNKHLQKKGIHYYLDVGTPVKKRFSPEVEITLFRILQEAIINIERHANAENVFVTLEVGQSFAEITIEDDGDGFNVDELMKHPIESGRGLGITGMKERASLLDGKLQIYSQPGEGTRVCMQVPLRTLIEQVVLLVDNDQEFVNHLAQRLKMRDIMVDIAYDGEKALSMLQEIKPGVVVLDLNMPGLHGLEVLQYIRKQYQDIKVIVLTQHGTDTDQAEAEAQSPGVFAFIEKSPDFDVLTAKIKEAMGYA